MVENRQYLLPLSAHALTFLAEHKLVVMFENYRIRVVENQSKVLNSQAFEANDENRLDRVVR